MAEISKKLWYRRGNVSYGITLYDKLAEVGDHYLSLQTDGKTVYAKLGPTNHFEASHLFVQKDNVTMAVLKTNTDDLPAGFIGMFEKDCPTGWTENQTFRGRFPRAVNASPGGVAGSSSHTHRFEYGSITSATGGTYILPTGSTPSCNGDHTHKTVALDFNAASATALPKYRNLVFCVKD